MVRNILIFTLSTIILMLGASCSHKTTPVSLPIDSTATFSASGNAVVPDQWWTAFGDKNLDTMVDSALTFNFNLKTAWERLQAARAVVNREASGLWPDIEATLRGSVDYPQPDFVGGESFRLGLGASYEVDLWGRIRSRVEAEKYRTEASLTDYRAASLSLSAEIVVTWYQLMEARKQKALVNSQIETNEKMLQLLKARFGSGQIRSVDILRQRQLIEATHEQKIAAETREQVLEHQLAVLLGGSPQQAVDSTSTALPDLPPLPQTGIAMDLIRRRPDVQSAFYRLQAADRDLASAISSRYPRLSLSTEGSLRANNVNNLFENWAYSIGGNLLAPIFYGGELSAEANRMEAIKKQRLYEYGQAVLTAFQEVEDALTREQKQQEIIHSLEEQVRLARQSYQQLRTEYLNGMGNFLDVLTALNEEQQLQRDLLSARMLLTEYRVALYRSLAGGFETPYETQE